MSTISNEVATQNAMNIILAASDCKNHIQIAIDNITDKNLCKAEEELKEAENALVEGHHYQTKLLQEDAGNDENFHLTLLLAHAQDTLMCTQSELYVVKSMLEIVKSYGVVSK